MPKMNFGRLTRGIKLLIEHIYSPLSAVASMLTVTGANQDNFETGNGSFRVTLNFPVVHERVKASDEEAGSVVTAPLLFPTFQEDFSALNANIDEYTLKEVSVSHDTRCEAGRVDGVALAVTDFEGSVNRDEATAYTLFISEHVISPLNFDKWANRVFEMKVPEIALIGEHLRSNPVLQSGIDVAFRHDRSYLVEILPEKTGRAMFSLSISLRFERKLTTRDTGATIQNIPAHNGQFAPVTQPIVAPVANALINADDASGVNTGFALIDRIISKRLKGGYRRNASRRYAENLKDDAGYEVIAVPMFAGWSVASDGNSTGGPTPSRATDLSPAALPWSLAGAGNFRTMDRAIIPLQYPITIHHVIVGANYSTAEANGTVNSTFRPVEATYRNEVGVGLLRGIRNSNFAIQQVAHAQWTPATIGSFLIDRGDYAHTNSSGELYGYGWDILSCPLVGLGGAGYFAQGKPVFAGVGETGTEVRSSIGGVIPVTGGAEQALDIRWKIDADTDPAGAVPWSRSMIIGHPGHWIYIICKKHLI